MRVLVTGASGFLGGHLARALRADGAVGASRTPQTDTSIEWTAPFDPTDPCAVRSALRDVDVVIHAAGRAHVLHETATDALSAFRHANVTSTRVLLDGARDMGVRHFVLLSSVSVYGDMVSDTVHLETPTAPSTPYGVSRLEAEQALRIVSAITTTVLRLPMAYGPGMKGNPLRLFDLVARGTPLPLGSIQNRRSLLYVGNLVEVVRRLLVAPPTSGSVLLVADAEPVSTPTLAREIAQALGRPSRVFPCPRLLLHAVARGGNRLLGTRFPLGPDALRRLESSLELDMAPLVRVVGAPAYERRHGLAATATWYLGRR
jgi:nucleoside-diphosphate-sugar epimerase